MTLDRLIWVHKARKYYIRKILDYSAIKNETETISLKSNEDNIKNHHIHTRETIPFNDF